MATIAAFNRTSRAGPAETWTVCWGLLTEQLILPVIRSSLPIRRPWGQWQREEASMQPKTVSSDRGRRPRYEPLYDADPAAERRSRCSSPTAYSMA
jgi:hypothetical protein